LIDSVTVKVMKGHRHKIGITLVEMLVVVAIVVILVSITVSIATRVDNQAKEQLIESTFMLLNTALQQFSDFRYGYDHTGYGSVAERNFYVGLDFPIDCNGFSRAGLETELEKVFNQPVVITATGHDPNYSSGEAMYLLLSRVPECRETLDKIDASLITNLGSDRVPMSITIGGRTQPLLRIVDPWGVDPLRRALRYDYYDEWEADFDYRRESKRNFPLIISAGPDRIFGTIDDIANR